MQSDKLNLVVFGDSNSVGFEILPPGYVMKSPDCRIVPDLPITIRYEYEQLFCWPTILRNKLGKCHLFNNAGPGDSNDSISRKVLYFFNSNKIDLTNTIVVIGWTFIVRTEFFDDENNKWINVNPHNTSFKKESVYEYYTELYNTHYGIMNYYKNIVYAANFLKANGIRFMFFNVDNKNNIDSLSEDNFNKIQNNFAELVDINWFADDIFIDYLSKHNFKRGEMGHFFEEGQYAWAEYMLNNLKIKGLLHE